MGVPHWAQYIFYSVSLGATTPEIGKAKCSLGGRLSFAETLGIQHHTGRKRAQHRLIADIAQAFDAAARA